MRKTNTDSSGIEQIKWSLYRRNIYIFCNPSPKNRQMNSHLFTCIKKNSCTSFCPPNKIMHNLKVRKKFMPRKFSTPFPPQKIYSAPLIVLAMSFLGTISIHFGCGRCFRRCFWQLTECCLETLTESHRRPKRFDWKW